MKRRGFLKVMGGATVALGVGGAGVWLSIPESEDQLTIDETLKKLEAFKSVNMQSIGTWDLSQVLVHCAQSVEYSMTGYPDHKPEWFKESVGPLAFSAFSSKGRMSHPLDEVIPGADVLAPDVPVELALARFEKSLLDFDQYTAALQPHFAFGALSKLEYERAHAMHFNNHLLELKAV